MYADSSHLDALIDGSITRVMAWAVIKHRQAFDRVEFVYFEQEPMQRRLLHFGNSLLQVQ